jgi:hypothetical protein
MHWTKPLHEPPAYVYWMIRLAREELVRGIESGGLNLIRAITARVFELYRTTIRPNDVLD